MKFLAVMLFVMLTVTVQAQVTTSSMSGQVTDVGGEIIGATVVAIHVPSGTVYGTVTNMDGRWSLLGMRPGGPYTVTVSYIGYGTVENRDIHLVVGDNFVLNVLLEEDVVGLAEVVVIGVAGRSNMSSDRAGAITAVSAQDMARMPSINRSINDMTRLTPQAQGSDIGGGNYRQNFITVDGAAFNNAFGIGSNLPGGGSPISIDALEQISVSLTPYDVRQSGFIGAAINAVTKSGTNEFKGSVYHYFTDDRLRGNKVGDQYITVNPSQSKLYGFTLGGPVIKDRLFFFVNYEKENEIAPGPPRVASTNGVANPAQNIARPTESDMQMISDYLFNTYGYETGPYQGYSFKSPTYRFLTRVDWNINQNHRFNIRYSSMGRKSPVNPSQSSAFNLGTGGRIGMNAMWYQNSGYFNENNFNSLSSELNSRFMEGRLNNTFRITYSYQDEPRSTGGKTFPFVDIRKDGDAYVSFGTELFSYGNLRQVATWNITDELTYTFDKHNLTFGVSYETNKIKNGFMRQGTGHYVFNSWEDFANGRNPVFYSITHSNTPDYRQVFPSFKFDQLSFYLQDEVRVNDRLNVTGGIRFDLPIYPAFPEGLQTHPMIANLDFNGTKYNTATMPKTRVMISPRLGFNYDLKGDRTIVLRGGTGIFTGRIPFVWIVSQSTDAGMLQTTLTYNNAADIAQYVGPFNPDIHHYLPTTPPVAGTQIPTEFTIMDPNFKMPQAWKSSLATDFRLPFGFRASVEGVFNKDINAVMIRNMGLVDPTAMNITGYPDHRMLYPVGVITAPNGANLFNQGERFIHTLSGAGQLASPAVVQNANGSYGLVNTNGAQPLLIHNAKDNGYYASLTFKVEKDFWHGLSGMVAYTRSWAESLHDGSGDQALSLWRSYTTIHGSNTPHLGYAGYVMPNNLITSLSYNYKGFTTSLFYRGGDGGRASYAYSNNIVRDGNTFTGINLMYIPKDESEITFVDRRVNINNVSTLTHTAEEQEIAFWAYIEQDPYLRARKGQYAEKNGLILPWEHRFDIRFTQDFDMNFGSTTHKLQIGLDIANFGNLLNSKWGRTWNTWQTNLLAVTNANNLTADGSVKPTFNLNPIAGTNDLPTETLRRGTTTASTYRMQFSLRYIF
ncbi:MAG: carboxypeptidase regulatory-like domain-containing protein [Dysgonamonadaceae bacterium]|nr:carboxypeptidase regulatory-like domain-containing protein [Dysgonamonadaceae bacterium]